MKFSQMEYKRPDVDRLAAELDRLSEALTRADDAKEAEGLFLDFDRLRAGYETMAVLCEIRQQIDTSDQFYDGEMAFIDEKGPELSEHFKRFRRALVESPFRPNLEERFGPLLFKNAELELKTFSPAIIELLKRENALCTEYGKLIASAQIPFEGEIYTLSQLGPFKQLPDDSRRRAAWQAEAGFYTENGQRLDEIYAELVSLRDQMARTLGYADFVELGYCRMQRNCYGRAEVDRFRKAVVKHIVPLAERVYREQAERAGLPYPLSFADAPLSFRAGNPAPKGSPEDILAAGKRFYHELSPFTGEFIDFMTENELLDLLSKKNKAGGGFCTEIYDYRSPFIFANFNGTSDDVETMTHEAGHALAAYAARDILPIDNQEPSLESCEVHSMSMEFFAWPWAELFYGEQADRFRYSHLAGAVKFIPYGTMVDHFQHIVYENPSMSPDQRHRVWSELLGVYMPWMRLGEVPFYGDGKGWQRQHHIYQAPFYYIDYCLAQATALQFWGRIADDREAAFKTYMSFVALAGSKTFTELLAGAGLSSPFEESSLADLAARVSRWLDAFPADRL